MNDCHTHWYSSFAFVQPRWNGACQLLPSNGAARCASLTILGELDDSTASSCSRRSAGGEAHSLSELEELEELLDELPEEDEEEELALLRFLLFLIYFRFFLLFFFFFLSFFLTP